MDKILLGKKYLVLKQAHFILYSLIMVIVASLQSSIGYGLYGVYQVAVSAICFSVGIATILISNKIENKKKYFLLGNVGLWIELFLFYGVGSLIKEFSSYGKIIGKVNPAGELSLFIIAFVFGILAIIYELLLQRKIKIRFKGV